MSFFTKSHLEIGSACNEWEEGGGQFYARDAMHMAVVVSYGKTLVSKDGAFLLQNKLTRKSILL